MKELFEGSKDCFGWVLLSVAIISTFQLHHDWDRLNTDQEFPGLPGAIVALLITMPLMGWYKLSIEKKKKPDE